jgi:hypothetical protein
VPPCGAPIPLVAEIVVRCVSVDPDHGYAISYLALGHGVPVLTKDGATLGTVKSVLHVKEKDIFDGIVVQTKEGERFVDAPEIVRIYERAVVTSLSPEEAAALGKPHAGPVRRWLARR